MKTIAAPPPDSLIDPYADLPEATPVAPVPAPPVAHALHVPAIHIPLPTRRTVLEVLLIVALLASLVGHLHLALPHFAPTVAGPLHAKLVQDIGKDGYATAVLRSDAKLAPDLKALDCTWEWVNADEPAVNALLHGHSTPALVVTSDRRPDPVLITDAPATGAEALAVVRSLRGNK